ncbi:MAG: 1-(5-phosphoribosyl)-5-[(5-phosphoribosylamino)methylideneamino]imidazole-4-carboxamide isomerase [Chloroflexi bacterium]|nr:1-(5-phosphoribosyl)-5-[(5-phosphoribosylamino)methylideneamino]imidazole-4-carboxamide isomerase [Chloroflexota bacterium]
MDVIPAIDLRAGRCVRLYQGDYARETVFSQDPAGTARRWYQLGAARLHVVDLDGAAGGAMGNAEAIRAILRAVPIPVQVGGGIRTTAAIAEVLSWGTDRVILGSSAVLDPQMVAEACRAHPGAIVVSIDARDGQVAIQGWREATSLTALQLMRQMAELGVARFIYTDITRDGTITEPNFQALQELCRATGSPVIAAGGVSSVAHLSRLRQIGVEGAIVGQALYTGALDLKAALVAALPR